MMWSRIILINIVLLLAMHGFAQKERKYIRQGNKEFEKQDYENSEVLYRKAMDLDEKKTHKPLFNIGDALYKQEKYDDAVNEFNNLTDYELSKDEKAKIYHNLGNSYLKNKKYKESIEAYKNALRNNPNDMDTKYNLVYAKKKLDQQQQQQQNQDQNKDQNKDNKDQNKDKQNQDQNKDKQDKKDDQQDKQDQNQDKQQQQKQQISKEDAERILQALANDEKKTQQKVKEQKAAAAKVKVEKEW